MIKTSSAKETGKLAQSVASKIKGGQVLALSGNLGSGKTTFIKALAGALGVKKSVVSPTFLILKTYDTGHAARKRGVNRLIHVDAYRLEDPEELIEVGLFEYMARPGTLTVIEWAEKVKSVLPAKAVWIKIKIGRKNDRIFSIKGLQLAKAPAGKPR